MTSVYHEKAAEQKIRDECGIPDDWSSQMWEGNVRFLGNSGPLARDICAKYGLDDWVDISIMITQATQSLLIPEGCRVFSYSPPKGHEEEGYHYLVTATKRDLEMGTEKYLSRLDEDQLCYAQDAIKELLARKKEEKSRTVWRVCDDWMCLGNFREEDYLVAVEFMADKAKQNHEEEPEDSQRWRALQIEVKAERVPESEYEGYFD